MSDDFVHLHVASGHSLRYGTTTPGDLVDLAAGWGQHTLALTDRDGLYGAVKFAQACLARGIAPVLGVDLAVGAVAGRQGRPPGRTPVRGGALVDPRLPRVTVLARGQAHLPPGTGWARLCRLVTATHLAGERGTPVTSLELVAEHVRVEHARSEHARAERSAALTVLVGPDSDVGRAVLQGRSVLARERLDRWRRALPEGALVVEVVCHEGPPGTPVSRRQAAAMLALADAARVPAVLTAAVRHGRPEDAITADVLDAARRLVALDTRHLDRVTTLGHLSSTPAMVALARVVCDGDQARADELLRRTLQVAADCRLDPRSDLGIGSVQLPEPGVLGIRPGESPQRVLAERCRGALPARYPGASDRERRAIEARLEDELGVVATLGYPTYFLTVATVCDLIRDMSGRVAARGSGAGSLINYLLGISGVDPIRYDLLMERFCSPLRAQLPDIDIDVESDRRTAIYERVLDRFGGDRVTCVSMMDSYRVRHAIRDVGGALGMPPTEIDAIAKAFPHIRARDARNAIADLPELRASGLDAPRLQTFFDLVERVDGLPRHVALHPCGVVLSNSGLLDRTPVEASWLGFPMSHFDKDDVEAMGLLKLDVLGIRMQSAMAHAVAEVERVDGIRIDLDDQAQVPLDDEATFRLIRSTHTLGCFQIESPGQRELIGKFGPERFEDIVIDISLFRPGPVKSDMITPFLRARQGWAEPDYLHETLVPALQETAGVVVFHEQVLRIVAETAGVTLAEADEVRRALGSPQGQVEVEAWWRPAAAARGYAPPDVDRIWEVLHAFASFGFCKAHAAAFALPTYQSAWLKTHHPAAFLAGVLTHDPGMYPKRLILDDARNLGIAVLGLDVNASGDTYRVERVEPWHEPPPQILDQVGRAGPAHPDLPDARDYGIRLSLADVKGISDAEVQRLVAGQPYVTLADVWNRAQPSRPVLERLVLAGALDSLYGLSGHRAVEGLGRRGKITRRDLLLHVAELERYTRATTRRAPRPAGAAASRRPETGPELRSAAPDVRSAAARQSQEHARVTAAAEQPVQLSLDLGDAPELTVGSGLPEMTQTERVRAELEVLGLDATAHVLEPYAPMLRALGAVRSVDLLRARSRSTVLAAGVKVATQTPPVRSGRRVVFLTLDDTTGPIDATFFEDVQGPYAATVFHSWMLLVRGEVRRTGPRGISLRATGAWELGTLWEEWLRSGPQGVHELLARSEAEAVERAAEAERATGTEGSPRTRRVLLHASGFAQSPYADIRPAGGDPREAPRKLWHSSPGSSGH
ncbi:DNA polymerase III subunit alpha [Arsenicicoccus sp. oral taxon 190]|uniref:DNA polymerase III subunit alpha n=1 Tax=Arsenicicoccus sp. oral taxon 190 TaxID=1658671 RepID=UPI00067A23B3|nr:DNA polymerase III subunit alpha [Arsenicicoccus sp. oral taxon 190]AKT52033.1 DNA polymerase III subunit alpha [Arsenicicoccus sp. oral taxon 190]